SMNTIGVTEDKFIRELKLHFHESGKLPLELISIIPSVWKKMLIAIPGFNDNRIIYLDEIDHVNYQGALSRVGAIIDKMTADLKEPHSLVKTLHPKEDYE
ncbi:hypothetical protein P3596_24015, partial [Vibrio parahaemolyticus]|nr:hypothetical protein [Vibrio parahaemolyticus]